MMTSLAMRMYALRPNFVISLATGMPFIQIGCITPIKVDGGPGGTRIRVSSRIEMRSHDQQVSLVPAEMLRI